jgi:drug/metabolite transporter (DMT)-like permease
VGSLAAVGLVTRGYQFAATSTLAVFEYSFLISASLWAFALRGETLAAPGALGIALIIASGVIAAGASSMPRRPVAREPTAQDQG